MANDRLDRLCANILRNLQGVFFQSEDDIILCFRFTSVSVYIAERKLHGGLKTGLSFSALISKI